MKVTKCKAFYRIQQEKRVRRVSQRQLNREVVRKYRGKRYLIQRGVSLLSINGKPVDFRVLLLKPQNKWEFLGTMGKVAAANHVVTNYKHGGRPIGLNEALRQTGWKRQEIRNIETRMNDIALMTANAFNKRYKYCRRLGIDFAIDNNKKIWILEVNTNPYYELFRHHRNKQLYRKIERLMGEISKLQSNR